MVAMAARESGSVAVGVGTSAASSGGAPSTSRRPRAARLGKLSQSPQWAANGDAKEGTNKPHGAPGEPVEHRQAPRRTPAADRLQRHRRRYRLRRRRRVWRRYQRTANRGCLPCSPRRMLRAFYRAKPRLSQLRLRLWAPPVADEVATAAAASSRRNGCNATAGACFGTVGPCAHGSGGWR